MVRWNSRRLSLRPSNKLLGRAVTIRRTPIHAEDITSNFIIYYSQCAKCSNHCKIEFKETEIVDIITFMGGYLTNFDLLTLYFLLH